MSVGEIMDTIMCTLLKVQQVFLCFGQVRNVVQKLRVDFYDQIPGLKRLDLRPDIYFVP